MLTRYSIKDLYSLALAEGEGMGTAYEYYVKRRALGNFLAGRTRPKSVLIAGLPEKYGVSLDFLLLANELDSTVTIVDDRPQAIERLYDSLATLGKNPGAPDIKPPAIALILDIGALPAIKGAYDLVLSSEVLQRLSPDTRLRYVSQLSKMSTMQAFFCPNAGNEAHNNRSGLGGLQLEELRELRLKLEGSSGMTPVDTVAKESARVGFIDMPPFPPGITRSAEQREEATTGRFEAFVMWGLGVYANLESVFPSGLRRRHSHIIYAFAGA